MLSYRLILDSFKSKRKGAKVIREIVVANAGWFSVLAFLILGWCFYMSSTALMKGTIFIRLRGYIGRRAEGSKFFMFLREMLGCLMCTSMETSFWTVGIFTFTVGMYFHAANQILSGTLQILGTISSVQSIIFPVWAEAITMLCIAIAVSFAISGEAWAIQTVVEHNEQKFLDLRAEFREKEEELLQQLLMAQSIETGQEQEGSGQ